MADATTATRIMIQFLDLTFKTVINTADLIMSGLKNSSNPVDREFAKAIKEGNTKAITCDVEDAKVIKALLLKSGIGCANENVLVNKDGITKNVGYIIVLNSDVEAAQKIVDKHMMDKSKGIVSPSMLHDISDGKTRNIDVVGQESALLMIKRCEEARIPINIKCPAENVYKITFPEKKIEDMNLVRLTVGLDLAGKSGKFIKEQVDWNIKNKKELADIIKGEKKFNTGANAYIVDVKGKNFIKIDAKTISINDKTYPKESRLGMKRAEEIIAGADNPTLINTKDLSIFLSKNENERYKDVLEIQRDKFKRPVPSLEDTVNLAKEREVKKLVYQKLMQTNFDDKLIMTNPYNNEESFLGFTEKEKKNYESIHDAGEADMPIDEAVILNEAQSFFDGTIPTMEEYDNTRASQIEDIIFGEEIDVENIDKNIELEKLQTKESVLE